QRQSRACRTWASVQPVWDIYLGSDYVNSVSSSAMFSPVCIKKQRRLNPNAKKSLFPFRCARATGVYFETVGLRTRSRPKRHKDIALATAVIFGNRFHEKTARRPWCQTGICN